MTASDRLNPMVVKEVRQGLRTRAFAVFFGLLLTVCVVVALTSSAVAISGEVEAGKGAFLSVLAALSFVAFFVIPYAAYRSMARERDDETWVLLTLTGLGARRILAGKVASAMLQGGLYASAAAPFLLFSYFLNGVDLPSVLVTLAFVAALQLFLTSLAVSVATFAETKVMRGLVHLTLLGVLFWAWSLGISGGIALTEALVHVTFDDEVWVALGAGVFATASTGVLMFESAASRLSLSSEPYARGPRLAFAVQVLGYAAFFALGAWASGEGTVLAVGVVVLSAYVAGVGLALTADLDGMSRAQREAHARVSLLAPGALRAFVLVVLLLVAVTGGLGLAAAAAPNVDTGAAAVAMAAPCFALFYLSAPQVVARWFSPSPRQMPVAVRVAGVALFALGSGLPPLVGAFAEDPVSVPLNVLNPIVGLVNLARDSAGGPEHELALLVPMVASVGMVLWALAALWLAERRRPA